MNAEMASAIRASAERLGISPHDLATAISFETGGTFDPWKAGPTTQWGQHRGLLQWGEPQRKKYGVTQDMSVPDQLRAAERYLTDAGVKPGHQLLDVYSAINAGRVGLYDRSDANNGGTPGTVRDKVEQQMGGHKLRAMALLGGGGVPGAVSAPVAGPVAGAAPMSLAPDAAPGGLGGGLDAATMQALQGIAAMAQEKPEAMRINPEAIHYASAPGLARGRAKALSQIMQARPLV